MSIGTILIIILIIALVGGFSGIGGGPFYGTGYYGGGGLGLVLLIVLAHFKTTHPVAVLLSADGNVPEPMP